MTDETTTEPTLEQLRKRAAELDVEGRSSMNKDQLTAAIADAERAAELAAAEEAKAAEADKRRREAAAKGLVPGITADPEPSPPAVTGRPPLSELAAERAANRNPRVIGAAPQED